MKLLACTTCMQSATGIQVDAINQGIVTLLVIVYAVLFGFGGFFFYLWRRAR